MQGYFIAFGLEGLGANQAIAASSSRNDCSASRRRISRRDDVPDVDREQITSRGIGNGVSLIIMAGIVAQLPSALAQLFEGGRTGTMNPLMISGVVLIATALVLGICFMERAQRRVLIQYPKRQSARGAMQQERSHLPLKVNTAGVIPPIFASSLLLMPLTVLQMAGSQASARIGRLDLPCRRCCSMARRYICSLWRIIAFFCFFYTAVQFNRKKRRRTSSATAASSLASAPASRPSSISKSAHTHHGGRRGLPRPDLLIPEILFSRAGVLFYWGGPDLLIVVNVTMDTVNQNQSHLIATNMAT